MLPGKNEAEATSMPVEIGSASCLGSGTATFYCSQSGAELQVAGCADETATAPENCKCDNGQKNPAHSTNTCYRNDQQDCMSCYNGFALAPIPHIDDAQQCLPAGTGTPATPTCRCDDGTMKAADSTATCYQNGQQDCDFCTETDYVERPVPNAPGAKQCRLPPVCGCDHGTKNPAGSATCFTDGQQDCYECTEPDYNLSDSDVPGAPGARSCVLAAPVCECQHGRKNPAETTSTCYEPGQQDCLQCTDPGYVLTFIRMDWKACLPTCEILNGACSAPGYNVTGDSSRLCRAGNELDVNMTTLLFPLPNATDCEATCCTTAGTPTRHVFECECANGEPKPAEESQTCHRDGQQDCAQCFDSAYVLTDIPGVDGAQACLPTCGVLGGACSAPGYNVTGDSSQLCRAAGDLNVTNSLFSLPDMTDCEATCCTNATTETHIATGGHSKVEEVIFGGGGTNASNESTTNATEEAVEAIQEKQCWS